MIKLLAALILSLTSVATVVYVAPTSFWQGWSGDHDGDHGGDHDGPRGGDVRAPEIDPASAAGALTLLMGGVLVLRSRVAKR